MVHNFSSSCKKAQTMKGTEFFKLVNLRCFPDNERFLWATPTCSLILHYIQQS
jgi:hypothetical protein